VVSSALERKKIRQLADGLLKTINNLDADVKNVRIEASQNDSGINVAENSFTFTAPSSQLASAQAVASKGLTVTFPSGSYVLDDPRLTLSQLLQRAGGLTPEAMPSAGIFLRSMGGSDPEKRRANLVAGVENADPTSNGINEILKRLSETMRLPGSGAIETNPLLHGLTAGSLNRLVMNLPGLLAGDPAAEVELQDRDEIIIPRRTDVAYVVGETASPFAAYKVNRGTEVKNLIDLAGGPTRNADTWHIRLLKADGRIIDSRVMGKAIEPGDAVLVPQRFRLSTSWQENLQALTPLALILNAINR